MRSIGRPAETSDGEVRPCAVLVEARRRLTLGALVEVDVVRVLSGGQTAEACDEVLVHVEIVGHRLS
jgi:hypothetical protein